MGTQVSFIFSGYNPYIGGVKPSFFHGFLGSKGKAKALLDPFFLEKLATGNILFQRKGAAPAEEATAEVQDGTPWTHPALQAFEALFSARPPHTPEMLSKLSSKKTPDVA